MVIDQRALGSVPQTSGYMSRNAIISERMQRKQLGTAGLPSAK